MTPFSRCRASQGAGRPHGGNSRRSWRTSRICRDDDGNVLHDEDDAGNAKRAEGGHTPNLLHAPRKVRKRNNEAIAYDTAAILLGAWHVGSSLRDDDNHSARRAGRALPNI
jgi:hypothetical protein